MKTDNGQETVERDCHQCGATVTTPLSSALVPIRPELESSIQGVRPGVVLCESCIVASKCQECGSPVVRDDDYEDCCIECVPF